MCSPFLAPVQLGKLVLLSNPEVIDLHISLGGTGMHSDRMTDKMALHTSQMMMFAVETPILYV
jgi:hypothetical protein